MYIKKYNEFSIVKDIGMTEEEFWDKVKEALKLFTENEYICTCHMEDSDIFVIHYNYADPSYGDYYPYWLLPEEEETVVYEEDKKEDEVPPNAKN